MIKAVIVMNDQGKPRLIKFYDYQPVEKQHELIRTIYSVLCSRAENVSNFIQADPIFGADHGIPNYQHIAVGAILSCTIVSQMHHYLIHKLQLQFLHFRHKASFEDARLVYKTFATLYFVFIFDSAENELAMLDLMQVFVETLDKCFSNVCELDIVFNFAKVHTILDEIVLGGQVLETNSAEIVQAVEEVTRLEKASNTILPVPKSISGWQAR